MEETKNILFSIIAVVTGLVGITILIVLTKSNSDTIIQGKNLLLFIFSTLLIGTSVGFFGQIKIK